MRTYLSKKTERKRFLDNVCVGTILLKCRSTLENLGVSYGLD
jgi:hypothetical protein